ncbi:MAG: hypothetical protein DRP41_02890 [Thermodesulfobacteriota bacterium]|nr:MAG: hypothetical protein DRP41_02890 [Thermodesulfobacteriota bacterium]
MNIEDYKKKNTKKIKCPSGLEVTINNITPYTLLRIVDKLGINPTREEVYTKPVIDALFKAFLKEPVIGKDIEIEDFLREDYIFLHNLIFEKVTLPEE